VLVRQNFDLFYLFIATKYTVRLYSRLYLSIFIVLFSTISYFAIILDGVHLSRGATSAPDTDSASLLLLIFCFFCFFFVFFLLHFVWIKMYIRAWAWNFQPNTMFWHNHFDKYGHLFSVYFLQYMFHWYTVAHYLTKFLLVMYYKKILLSSVLKLIHLFIIDW